MKLLRDRPRLVGAVAVLGSLALVASVGIQTTVPAPDAYQFNPALTGPQTLRETVAPGLTLAGVAAHVVLLVALGGKESGTLRRWSRRVTLVGLVFTFVGYAGLFTFDTAIGSLGSLAAGLFALLAVGAVGLTGVGVGLYGVALLRAGETVGRVAGALFLVTPLVGVVSTFGQIGWPVPTVVYAAGMAVLGYDRWRVGEHDDTAAPSASAE